MQTPRGRVSGPPPSRRAPSEIADRPAAASRPVWVAPERQGTRGRRLRGAPPRTRVRRLRRARWLRDESWSYGAPRGPRHDEDPQDESRSRDERDHRAETFVAVDLDLNSHGLREPTVANVPL